MPEISLEQQMKELTERVQKHSKLIAQTGKQLMEVQMKEVKSKMAAIDVKQPSFDPDDFASNEDIAQLVFEVLNQLEYLEDRSIKRAYNSHILSESADSTKIAPLCNKDGEPALEIFPKTVKHLKELKPLELIQIAEFYDLFVDEPYIEDQKRLESPNITREEAIRLSISSKTITSEQRLAMSSESDLKDVFDEFTRYIGVRIRRGSGW